MDLCMPSICIPQVFHSSTKGDIKLTLEGLLGKGSIYKIDYIYNKHSPHTYNTVFVHFNPIKPSTISTIMAGRLNSGLDVKIVYSDPWIWKCYRRNK
jgi:hypothetical protein